MALLEVFSTFDYIECEFIEDLLHKNNIDFITKNKHLQNTLSAMNVFVGQDTVSGPLRILIREEDKERCLKIIEANSIEGNNVQKEIENIIEKKEERKESDNEERRQIYFAYILAGLSFLIIPYIINIYVLTKLAKTKRVPAIQLFILSTVFGLISSVFLFRAVL